MRENMSEGMSENDMSNHRLFPPQATTCIGVLRLSNVAIAREKYWTSRVEEKQTICWSSFSRLGSAYGSAELT